MMPRDHRCRFYEVRTINEKVVFCAEMVLFVRYSAVFVTQKKVFVIKKKVFVTKKKVFVTDFFFSFFLKSRTNKSSHE